MAPKKQPSRWNQPLRLRFSLRALLAAMLLAVLALGAARWYMAPYRMQRRAAAAFEEAGGTVTTVPGGPAWLRSVFGDEPFEEMFSFFPCTPAGGDAGFARPRVELPGFINPDSFRVPRGAGRSAAVISVETARSLWGSVRAQVENAGLSLGVSAEMPPRQIP